MKAVLVIAVVLVACVALGWLTFQANSDRSSMTVETQEIKEDTTDAARKGKEALQETGEAIRRGLNDEPEPTGVEPVEQPVESGPTTVD